jgi:hypothetical protein
MPLERPAPIDTRALFRPVSGSLVTLLRGLPQERWDCPTVAGAWVVRDVVAHLLDSTLRRLSFHRDGMTLGRAFLHARSVIVQQAAEHPTREPSGAS